jgi:hypothetical protein
LAEEVVSVAPDFSGAIAEKGIVLLGPFYGDLDWTKKG